MNLKWFALSLILDLQDLMHSKICILICQTT